VDLDDVVVLDVGATITGRALRFRRGIRSRARRSDAPRSRILLDAHRHGRSLHDGARAAHGRAAGLQTDDRYMERTVDPSAASPIEVRLLQRSALR
jgi:hypothetical protein